MFRESRNNPGLYWQPSASLENLQRRAAIIRNIRAFFEKRGVLEVDTPLLSHTSVTDPYIESIPVHLKSSTMEETYYLQTSPEYAMKRLLAAGSGPIFQICKAFRQGEHGKIHNPEFTMLEWYRPFYDHHQLMNEMDDLLQMILHCKPAERKSYSSLFAPIGLDPHTASIDDCKKAAETLGINVIAELEDRDDWLQLILSEKIEPEIGQECPCFIYDFPASQAALSRLQNTEPAVASRFEVYFKGLELANGFHELNDPIEQRRRFENNIAKREAMNLKPLPVDEFFLAALAHGLPDCAGVALGVDRLVMIATNAPMIHDILSFDIRRA